MNFPRSTLSSVPGVERERLGWQRVDLRGEGRALPSGFDFPRHRGGLTSQTAQGLPGVPGFQAESPVETARMFWSSEPSETVFSGSSGVLTTPAALHLYQRGQAPNPPESDATQPAS